MKVMGLQPETLRWLSGGNEDVEGFSGARLGVAADDDFDVAAEEAEQVYEAFDGETVEAITGEH